MTIFLAEDKALRELLKGMTVTDQKADGGTGGTRNVGVWFGQPDQEIRAQSYPYITIDMIDIAEDFARSMRGLTKPSYMPDPDNMEEDVPFDPEVHDWHVNYPIPVNIDYQVTTYARQPRHDREILAQILYTKIPLRFAVLEPDDGTVRRLDLLDISKRDITEQAKRLFVNVFTLRVSSEMSISQYNLFYKAQQVDITGTEGSQILGRSPFIAVDPITIQ